MHLRYTVIFIHRCAQPLAMGYIGGVVFMGEAPGLYRSTHKFFTQKNGYTNFYPKI